MMRVLRVLVALVCLAIGVAVGVLNTGVVRVDLGFLAVSTTLGVALLVAMLLGVILGGLVVAVSVVWPLRRRLARQGRAQVVDAQPGSD